MIKLKTLLGEAGKFYKGGPYNDEPFNFRDDKQSLSIKTKPEWDAFVDKYNSINGYETKTTKNGGTYDAEIKNSDTGLIWRVQGKGNNWSYKGVDLDEYNNPKYCKDVEELIANFNEKNGTDSDIN